jgi:hypothetical protein
LIIANRLIITLKGQHNSKKATEVRGIEAKPPPTTGRKSGQDVRVRGRSRAGGLKHDVCARKPIPLTSK